MWRTSRGESREVCWDTGAAGIRVCRNGRFGRVEVKRDDDLDRWLVLRVGGPHPQVHLFSRVYARSWHAEFRLCRAGRYTIHVRAMLRQPWLSWLDNWTTYADSTPCMGPWDAGVLLQQSTFQFDGHASGSLSCMGDLWSWPVDEEGSNVGSTMLEQITPAPHPNRSSMHKLFGALTFTEGRRPKAVERAVAVNHRPEPLRICVVGDSQMRTLADGMVQHIAESGRGECDCQMLAARSHAACLKNLVGTRPCTRRLCVGNGYNVTLSYFRASYGHELGRPWPDSSGPTLVEHLGSACTAILVNSGQWWASWKPKPRKPHAARAPGEYGVEIDATMARLGALATRGRARVAWVATNPYPINAGGPDYVARRARPYDMSACPPGERRFLHVIHEYNQQARRLAGLHGVDFVDTWSVALPLFDVSADGAHYAWPASPVARPQAARAIRWVVPVDGQHSCLGVANAR